MVTTESAFLGPVACHDCHAPALYWLGRKVGWRQRDWNTKGKAPKGVLVKHRCTAAPLGTLPTSKMPRMRWAPSAPPSPA